MQFQLDFSQKARKQMQVLQSDHGLLHHYKAVEKALDWMQIDLKHPSLHTHKMQGNLFGEEVFETYVENHSPGAYRIFWSYGNQRGLLHILSIEPHLPS
jgi:hypothetical protein